MHIMDKCLVYRIDRETSDKAKQLIWKMAEIVFTENHFVYVHGGMYKTIEYLWIGEWVKKL